jgi:hypothetical protein
MTYARARLASQYHGAEGAGVSHSAELVSGDSYCRAKAPSPQGEKGRCGP